MKLIKNLAAALILASVLSVNVYAGDQPIGGSPTPPPATMPDETTQKTEATTTTTETQQPTMAEELWVDALMALFSLY